LDIYSRKRDLLKKYLNNDCSQDELEELLGYLKSDEGEVYEEVTADLWKNISEERHIDEQNAHALIENAVNAGKSAEHARYRPIRWYSMAAAALLVLAIGVTLIYLIPNGKRQPAVAVGQAAKPYKKDIKPGGIKAILRAGQSQVLLNKRDTSFMLAGNTVDIKQGDVKVDREMPVEYTLITPKGGEYSIILSDGTKVWLNADSKLVYPSVFNGNMRKVQLTGEAYFDVKTDADHPFIVHTERQDIRVLGTEFNIQAYPDEQKSVTTLVNGKVQVNSNGESVQLAQGQEAVLGEVQDGSGAHVLVQKADIKQAIAWKEGYFRFDYTDIHEIMRRLSRWYDVEVSFESGVGHKEFLAFINRNNNISEILGMLEGTGEIHFKIEGRKVTVMGGGQ